MIYTSATLQLSAPARQDRYIDAPHDTNITHGICKNTDSVSAHNESRLFARTQYQIR